MERVQRILSGGTQAAYLIAKQVDACVDVEMEDLETLWEAHGDALQQFAGLRAMMDEGFEPPEEVPVQSLLDLKLELADRFIRNCGLCEQNCFVDRSVRDDGKCGMGYFPGVVRAAMDPEPAAEISPALTVYFSGCNFTCFYCNAHEMAFHPEAGERIVPEDLAARIEENFERAQALKFTGGEPAIQPHYILSVLRALELNAPVVLHTNGYWTPEIGSLLEGAVDVAIVDFKFGKGECARTVAGVERYWEVLTRNLKHAQTYDVLVRHVAIPGHVECCTMPILDWVSGEAELRGMAARVAEDLPIVRAGFDLQVLFTYEPAADALKRPAYNRGVSDEERQRVAAYAQSLQKKL